MPGPPCLASESDKIELAYHVKNSEYYLFDQSHKIIRNLPKSDTASNILEISCSSQHYTFHLFYTEITRNLERLLHKCFGMPCMELFSDYGRKFKNIHLLSVERKHPTSAPCPSAHYVPKICFMTQYERFVVGGKNQL